MAKKLTSTEIYGLVRDKFDISNWFLSSSKEVQDKVFSAFSANKSITREVFDLFISSELTKTVHQSTALLVKWINVLNKLGISIDPSWFGSKDENAKTISDLQAKIEMMSTSYSSAKAILALAPTTPSLKDLVPYQESTVKTVEGLMEQLAKLQASVDTTCLSPSGFMLSCYAVYEKLVGKDESLLDLIKNAPAHKANIETAFKCWSIEHIDEFCELVLPKVSKASAKDVKTFVAEKVKESNQTTVPTPSVIPVVDTPKVVKKTTAKGK